MDDYRNSHQRLGEIYDDVLNNKFENILWEIEERCLKDIFVRYNINQESKVLDFACGTARITSFLDTIFSNVTGVDISESMLDKAKKRDLRCKFILRDITKEPLDGKFDLLTSFRFFLNANDELCNEVLQSLKKNMTKDSIFVFNIHGNRNSILGLIFFIQKKLGMQGVLNTMSYRSIKNMFNNNGYEIIEYRGIGLFPGRKNVILLPQKLLIKTEILLGKIPFIRYFCKDYLFVVRLK